MTISLVEDLRGLVAPDLMSAAAMAHGMPEEAMVNAIGSAAASVLAGLARAARSPEKAELAMAVLSAPANDLGMLAELKTLFAPQLPNLAAETTAAGLVEAVLGDQATALSNAIQTETTVSQSAAAAAMTIGGALVAAVVAAQLRRSRRLTAPGLAQLLEGQGAEIEATVPAYLVPHLPGATRPALDLSPVPLPAPARRAAQVSRGHGGRWARRAVVVAALTLGALWWVNANVGKHIDAVFSGRKPQIASVPAPPGAKSAVDPAVAAKEAATRYAAVAKLAEDAARDKAIADARRAAELKAILDTRAQEEADASRRAAAIAEQVAKEKAAAIERRAGELRAATEAKAAADAKTAAELKASADARTAAEAAAVEARAATEAKAHADAAERKRAAEVAEAEAKRIAAEVERVAAEKAHSDRRQVAADTRREVAIAQSVPALAGVSAAARSAIARACQDAVTEAAKAGAIRFRIASATITPDSAVTLDRVAAALKACPAMRVRIEGHTDAAGGTGKNQQLSESRARAVAGYLAKTGVPTDALLPVGLGDTVPVAANTTEENRARNRRIEFIVSDE